MRFTVIHLALIDHSTVQHNMDLDKLAHVLNVQLGHVAQTGWPIFFDVRHYHDHVDKNGVEHPRNPKAWPMYLLDDADQANALGYHDVLPDGRPMGKVFLKTTMSAGLDPHVTTSHEAIEISGDPYCRATFDIGRDAQGRQWMVAAEFCDMDEADEDGYDIEGVRVSNFATPNWFDPNATEWFDWNRKLSAPLTLNPGGYASVWVEGKGWTQVFNDRATPLPSRFHFSHRIERRVKLDVAQREAPIDGLLVQRYDV